MPQNSFVFISPNSKSKTYHSSIVQLKINTAILLLLIMRKIVQISKDNLRKQRKIEVGEKGSVRVSGVEGTRL